MAMWHLLFGVGFGLIASIITIMATSNQRRKITNEERPYISPPGNNCTICLNNMSNDEMAYVSCGHAFHEICLRELRRHRQKTCPTCRQNI